MSQRVDGYKGGIQAGMVATDKHAAKLDGDCKSASKLLAEELSSRGYKCVSKLSKDFLAKHNIFVGCAPDGGAWFDKDGKLIVVFEAKKQGKGGNAIERWVKNYEVCRRINPDVKYITFGSGEGFAKDNYCWRMAKTYIDPTRDFNVLYPTGTSWFINTKGFKYDEIVSIMRDALTTE